MKILVVDDSFTIRAMLEACFVEAGHTVQVAEDGAQAIALAPEFQADIAFLDFFLPDMDGFEVLKQIRAKGVKSAVVMLTAHASEELEYEAIKKSALGCIPKPVACDELREIVEKAIIEHKKMIMNNPDYLTSCE